MKIRLLVALPLAISLSFSQLQAKPQPVAVDELRPTQQHQKTVLISRKVMEKYHYKKHRLNNKLSAEIFRQYLKLLDYLEKTKAFESV